MQSKKYLTLILVIVIALALAACAGKKTAATAAVKAAEDAFNAAKAELVKYIPDETKGVEDAIQGAKDNLAKGEYAAALTAANAIPDKVKELSALAATKKDELTKGWEEMSGGMPKMLETIKSRLDMLSKSRKLPANLDKTKLETAKGGYEQAAAMWEEAKTAYAEGNLADAMTKAKTVQEKAMEAMTTLGMQVPPAATQ